MIKRIRCVRKREELPLREFHEAWPNEVAQAVNCPADIRPVRTVACTTLGNVTAAVAPHDGMRLEWFSDLDSLQQFDAWLCTQAGRMAASVVEPESTVSIIAEEVVLRGADWLEQRWAQGGAMYKHMALAKRAEHLSASDFSQSWRSRAGKLGGTNARSAIAIPDGAKGLAYVQNHPIASSTRESTYDAINEVYFETLEDMRARIAFFMNQDVVRVDADLVSSATFVAVIEHVIDCA